MRPTNETSGNIKLCRRRNHVDCIRRLYSNNDNFDGVMMSSHLTKAKQEKVERDLLKLLAETKQLYGKTVLTNNRLKGELAVKQGIINRQNSTIDAKESIIVRSIGQLTEKDTTIHDLNKQVEDLAMYKPIAWALIGVILLIITGALLR